MKKTIWVFLLGIFLALTLVAGCGSSTAVEDCGALSAQVKAPDREGEGISIPGFLMSSM